MYSTASFVKKSVGNFDFNVKKFIFSLGAFIVLTNSM